MKTALVTALGSVSGDIVIKSLKRMGMRVIGCDIYPKEWVADAYNVDVFYRAPYVSDVEKYLGLPVLAVVPNKEEQKQKKKNTKKGKVR